MAQKSCEISHDLTSPIGAYERAYNLCRKAVMIEKMSTGYVGAAIISLTAKGDFGSWLRDLFHGKKVTIHLHYYERLVQLVEQQAARSRRQIDHIDDLVRLSKGRHDAVDECDMQTGMVIRDARFEAAKRASEQCLA